LTAPTQRWSRWAMAGPRVLVTTNPLAHDVRVDATAAGGDPGPGSLPAAGVVQDRGSFSHALCRACGWSGPGRRSRFRARQDLAEHLDDGCPPDEVPTTDGPGALLT
jgi:hypothetical protein